MNFRLRSNARLLEKGCRPFPSNIAPNTHGLLEYLKRVAVHPGAEASKSSYDAYQRNERRRKAYEGISRLGGQEAVLTIFNAFEDAENTISNLAPEMLFYAFDVESSDDKELVNHAIDELIKNIRGEGTQRS
ncbi:hypothetical protein [Bythopirellula polymerisocia]|uniref:hypothetical protein n=1 Tax=Bythopirellula polymerisocia TaxID=2528003 RepID=UPI0011B7BA3F|nr:hypothetical protein [Bythopirellula polymerisocia]